MLSLPTTWKVIVILRIVQVLEYVILAWTWCVKNTPRFTVKPNSQKLYLMSHENVKTTRTTHKIFGAHWSTIICIRQETWYLEILYECYLMMASNSTLSEWYCFRIGTMSFCRIHASPNCLLMLHVSSSLFKKRIKSFTVSEKIHEIKLKKTRSNRLYFWYQLINDSKKIVQILKFSQEH